MQYYKLVFAKPQQLECPPPNLLLLPHQILAPNQQVGGTTRGLTIQMTFIF